MRYEESGACGGGCGEGNGEDRERARSLGLDLTPLSLQQLVVYASGGPAVAGSLPERTSA